MEREGKAWILSGLNAVKGKIAFSGGLALASALASANPCAADERSDGVWALFRSANPLHTQIVGLTDPSAAGERVLLIAEPSPLLPKASFQEALRTVFGPALKSAELKRNPVGLDGWSEDVVATLSYPQTPQGRLQLRADMSLLAERLFGTAYKFAPLKLSETATTARAAAPPRLDAPPSLNVSAAELNAWLFKRGQTVAGLETGADVAVDALLVNGSPGVYLSHERGLVLLLLPRDEPINLFRAALREFAMETDAIVGAVAAGERRLLIVGRERDTSLMSVPPLRVETILALAETQESELGQSYERTAPFAGRLESGDQNGRDWAPVYLSRDLFNNEFGSLLNITDQMLKSWSMAGMIRYVNFNYAPRAAYPFPHGVQEALGDPDELTFNWNTTGVGAVVDFPQARIFTILRTGSLPVSYCPGETCTTQKTPAVTSAEEKAYDWFSGLRDPYLGRVVQYSSLYQIFRAFPVKATRDEAPPPNFDASAASLASSVREALAAIIDGKPEQALQRDLIDFQKSLADVPRAVREAAAAAAESEIKAAKEQFEAPGAILREVKEKCTPPAIASLAAELANRQARAEPIMCSEDFSGNLEDMERVVRPVIALAGDSDETRRAYLAAAKPIETGFIKTPSIVLSWAQGLEVIGGHNLYSRATRIETTLDVPEGHVQISETDGAAILKINPADSSHSSELARAFERNEGHTDAEMTGVLSKEVANARPLRLPEQGLALLDVPLGEGRGLSVKLEGNLEIGEIGQRPALNGTNIVTQYQAEATARNLDLFVARNEDGFYVLRYAPPPAISIAAGSEPALLEAVGSFAEQVAKLRGAVSDNPVRIGFSGEFSAGEIRAINLSQEMRSASGAGGGWLPPRPPGSNLWALGPEPRRPNGFFFVHNAQTGEEQVGYAARRDLGDTYTLESRSRSIGHAHELLLKQVNWEKATIKEIEPVRSAHFAGLNAVGFEVELPLTDPPFLQWVGVMPRRPLLMRIISYFRRQPAEVEREMVKNSILKVLKDNADTQAVPGDGMLALKAELLRNVKVDALEFYVNYGDSDLQLVENALPPRARANVSG
jgi:hypothetical protein